LPIVWASDVVILLSGARADDLAHLPRRLPTVARWSPNPVLLLVGNGYSLADVTRELGVPPLGRVPDDPNGAAVLCGRPNKPRSGQARSALGRFARKVATELATRERQPANASPLTPIPALRAVPGYPPTAVPANGIQFAPGVGTSQNDRPEGGQAS
jgi:hypothetical protein